MFSQALLFSDMDTEEEQPCSVCEFHLEKTAGFTEVQQDVFFRKMKEEPVDIMPIAEGPFPYRSDWCSRSGYIWGVSVPTSRHGSQKRYFVR